MSSGASLSGVDQMKAKLRSFGNKFPDAVGRALYQETQIEATEVVKRTPRDTGALRGSIRVVGPVRIGTTVYTMIVAGGAAVNYAVIVHENPDAHHPIGQWKYLESVIMESRPYIAQRVASRLDLKNVENASAIDASGGSSPVSET